MRRRIQIRFQKCQLHLQRYHLLCSDVIMEQTLYLVGLIGKHEELMALLTSTMKGGSNYSTYKVLRNFLGSEFEKVSFTNLERGKKIRATTILNSIEFCISVGSIFFVETFMNKDKRITRENIDDLQKQMDESMLFFHDWWKQIEGTAGDMNEIKTKKFISQITYANLRTGISGFFQYARNVFEHTNTPYVPFLH